MYMHIDHMCTDVHVYTFTCIYVYMSKVLWVKWRVKFDCRLVNAVSS